MSAETFENAVEVYLASLEGSMGVPMLPSRALSDYNVRLKRWNLRNVRGLLTFVSSRGTVWSFERGGSA